jgi:alanine dehydrogenase
MEKAPSQADILVDATQRRICQPVILNDWIGFLPEHAIVVDLAVDPYLIDVDPPVCGIEIPQGNLNQYIFPPDDPNWDKLVPSVSSRHGGRLFPVFLARIHPECKHASLRTTAEPLMQALSRRDTWAFAIWRLFQRRFSGPP